MATMVLSFTGCSLDDLPFGPGNKQEENKGNENTGADIPEEPLTSGPASVTITRATATTAHFEGCITNDDIDLDFVQITVRYAEPEDFSAMSENIPSVVITRPDFEKDNKFSFNIENLRHNTLYKFCAIVQYKSEVFYSDVDEFKTAGVDIELAVKKGSITDSSVEFIGSVHNLSPEDKGRLEIGLIYADNKSLVESGEGDMVAIETIAENGTFNLSLSSLYDGGPTFYFRSYIEQNGDYLFGEIDSFELLTEKVRLVKKITRHEKALDVEFSWIYEFEYDSRGRNTLSKVTEIEDGDSYGVHYTYDYSTNGVATVNERFYDNDELDEEQTYVLNVDNKGRVTNYDYTWEDNIGSEEYEDIYIYHYSVTADYSKEGFLNSWYESGDDGGYGVEYTYLDGRITAIYVDRDGDYDSLIHLDESFTSDHKVKHTSFDINKAIIPAFYPDSELIWFSNINIGTIGDYYFNRMYTECVYYWDGGDMPNREYSTRDANYKKTLTIKDIYYEGMDDEMESLPITTANYDKDGYPIEFIADIRQYDAEVEVTYEAGEILWEDEDGPLYEVVEVDRKIISRDPATSIGAATITIEYCE